MASGQLSTFLRQLRRVVGTPAANGPSDAQLLHRFLQRHDEEAFELLVWRHGAMVMNVCRRVLRREHDAEDAFQATFLTLVRKAGAIGKREAVGSWLYKVAYRIALRARGVTPSRPLPEGPLPDPSSREPIHDLAWREFGSAMDEEVHRLPNQYRVAVVLCYLEGQTIESAARTLDCPPGTVGTWLARGRELLRRRLVRRGFDVSSAIGARNVNVVAALSAALVNSTVQAALLGTAERAVAAGVISASVATLTKGALRAMTLTRWTATTAMVLILSVLGGGSVLLAPRMLTVEPARAASAAKDRGSSTGARNTAPVLLEWKFKKGQPFYQVYTTRITQTMKVMNNDVTQKQVQTFYFQWTPEKKVDGKWIIAQKILGVKMDIDIGGQPIKYDSTSVLNPLNEFFKPLRLWLGRLLFRENHAPNPLDGFYKALVGAEFKLVLDAKTLDILRIEGRKEFVHKLGAANKQMKPLLDKILSEEALKEMAEPTFAVVTNEPVKKGKTWKKATKLDMGPIGSYKNEYTYTYDGTDDPTKLDKIKVDTKLTYIAPEKTDGIGGLPFKIKSVDLRSKNAKGTVWFNRDKGRVEKTDMFLEMGGKLQIEIGGQPTQVELSQTQKTTIQTMDANPLGVKHPRAEEDKPK